MANYKVVFVRHGESTWNQENLFSGWTDVDLTENGQHEAERAGRLLAQEGFTFDVAYTSVLKRAIRTLWVILDKMDLIWIPVHRHWRLNERHYGALQGLNKTETAERYGEEQVFQWRRSYDVLPPLLDEDDERHPSQDPRYRDVPKEDLPAGEALKQTEERAVPFWNNKIVPAVQKGQKVIVVAHGNSLRAILKHIDGISEDEITQLNIPTGIPLVYELNENLQPTKHYYLGDPEQAKKAAEKVANQANNR